MSSLSSLLSSCVVSIYNLPYLTPTHLSFSLYSHSHLESSLFSHPQVKPSNIVIDAVSMGLMKGSLIDYATELIGSSFRVVENPQASTLLSSLLCRVESELVTFDTLISCKRRRAVGVGAG